MPAPTPPLTPPTGPKKTGFTVNSVTVIIGYETQNGIEEVVHQVDGAKADIVSVQHNVERKTRPVKDPKTGETLHHEPTGEKMLNLKVKYIED